jgi:protein TonB
MVVISSVILVISAVSVYQYYSEKSWSQVTSSSRNEVVFENRNKAYGAYKIRQEYDSRLVLIMFSFVSFIGVSYGSYLYFKDPLNVDNVPPKEIIDWENMTEINISPKEDIKEPEKVKPQPQPKVEQIQNLELVAVDKKVDTEAALQSEMKDKNTGLTKSEGVTTLDPIITIEKPIIVDTKPKEPVEFPTINAMFPGGETARQHFIIKNISFSDDIMESDGGKCYLRFVVNENGEISFVKITRGVPDCPSCDREAMRVVKNMPNWKPAEMDGEKVASYFDMTINFQVK